MSDEIFDERSYPKIRQMIELNELKQIASAHSRERMVLIFARANNAERVPYTNVFMIECPNCELPTLYFDKRYYMCLACEKTGKFDELKTTILNQKAGEEGKDDI